MNLGDLTIPVRVHIAWWVRPLIAVASFLTCHGIPVPVDPLAEWVAKHGMRTEVVR
jgi:hypothetical protein